MRYTDFINAGGTLASVVLAPRSYNRFCFALHVCTMLAPQFLSKSEALI